MRKLLGVASVLVLASCSNAKDASQPSSSATVAMSASPAAVESSGPSPTLVPVSASVAPSSLASSSAASPSPVEAPLPEVDVANIGMHVGGGKNDAAEKAPIKRSVEPHMDAFRRCWASVEDPKKGGDFGLDLTIPADGGKATQAHPRTSLKGDAFKACVLTVFEGIDFEKPKGGKTTVSYSLRFTPKK